MKSKMLQTATIKIPLGVFRDDFMAAADADRTTEGKLISNAEIMAVELLYDVYGSQYEITVGAYEMAAILKLAGFARMQAEMMKGCMEDA
jgi:hypothetical protein